MENNTQVMEQPIVEAVSPAPVSEAQNNAASVTANNLGAADKKETKGKKSSKKLVVGIIIAIISVFVGLFLILGIILAVIFWPKKVDLNDYVVVEFTGYETVGHGNVYFDTTAFMEDYGDKIEYSRLIQATGYGEMYEYYGFTAADAFLECFDVTLSQTDNLSNGTEVSLVWLCDAETIDQAFNYGVKYEEETYTVEGLERIEMFDPFENIEVSFEGTAPNGMVQILVNDYSGVYSTISYSASETSGLSNGDVITVSISCWGDPVETCIEAYGICPSATEKEYTVEGLDRYVSNIDEIDINALNAMIAQGQDIFNADVANNWTEGCTVDSFLYVGSYLLTPKPGRESQNESMIYLVYKVNATWKFTNYWWDDAYFEPLEYYYVVEFNVPIIDGDGNCIADTTNYYVPYEEIYYEYTPNGSSLSDTLWSDGFVDLESVYTYCVQSNVEYYNYQSTVVN